MPKDRFAELGEPLDAVLDPIGGKAKPAPAKPDNGLTPIKGGWLDRVFKRVEREQKFRAVMEAMLLCKGECEKCPARKHAIRCAKKAKAAKRARRRLKE